MQTIVTDTSVILAVVLGEPARERLIQLTKGAALIAPPSLIWEMGNALSAMMRRRRLSWEEAFQAWQFAAHIPVRMAEIDIMAALRLAAQLRLYAYDAYMLQCARQCNAPLLTLDQGLQAAARKAHIPLVEVEP